MSKNEKKKPIAERIADLKKQIVATTDKRLVAKQLDQLLSLQRQADIEPVELIVPTKEVKETIDFGAVKIMRTIRGFLFEAKGGMSTFVDNRMLAVSKMLYELFELHNKERNEEDEEFYNAFRDSVLYVFQAPIFASLDTDMLFGIATHILKGFNEYVAKNAENAPLHWETEDDIKANNETEQATRAAEEIVNAPLPPEI